MDDPTSRPVIVYADHSETEPRFLAKFLERLGHDVEVVHVADCEAAVGLRLSASPPSLMLLRGLMPGRLDGPAAIAEIRRREAEQGLPRMPLVIVSSSDAYLERGLDAGADGSLGRQWTLGDLQAVVTALLPPLRGTAVG